ncbi:MAG: hypothetical protein ACPGVY_12350 [Mycobacterium sp.]
MERPPSQPAKHGDILTTKSKSATGNCQFPFGTGKTWESGAFEVLIGDVTKHTVDVDGDGTTLGAECTHLAK